MYIKKGRGPLLVTLHDGTTMSRADLPPPATRRWVASRKGAVVRAVEFGLLTADEACALYGLTAEELDDWISRAREHGETALRATAVQKYRQP